MIAIDTSSSQVNNFGTLAAKFQHISQQKIPDFATYKPDFKNIRALAKKYGAVKNIVVIGRGGSITSTEAIYKNLGWFQNNKRVYLCNSSDPDFLQYIKKQCRPEDSLIISISKSGTNIEHLENTFAFADTYRILVVTGTDNNNPLREAALVKKWEIIDHPNISGRYSGNTECAMVPCALIGIDVERVSQAMERAYHNLAPSIPIEKNDALRLAAVFYELEQKGFIEIFFSIYSVQAFGFGELASQLFHESICKDEKQGQTLVAFLSPESQHHFSQRFYGGRKNICGLFLNVKNYTDEASRTNIPPEIKDLMLREGKLGDINHISLAHAIHCEYEGNKEDTIRRAIPLVTLELDQIDETSTGELIALLQYMSVYSSWLREVDPFNQPHVESSKAVSFEKRKQIAAHI